MAGTVNKCKTSILASSPALPNAHRKETPAIPKTLTEIMTSPGFKTENHALVLGKKKKKTTKCIPLKADERI